MKKGTRKVIFFSTLALIAGGSLYYFLVYKKNKVAGKRADFIANGFVYTVGTQTIAYPKKAGEFGGKIVESYRADSGFWLAKNSQGQDILLKKSEVAVI